MKLSWVICKIMKPENITSKLVEKYGMKKNNCFKRRQNMSKGNIENWDK